MYTDQDKQEQAAAGMAQMAKWEKESGRVDYESDEQREGNRKLSAPQVVQVVREHKPHLLPAMEIVGAWVWATFSEKPSEEDRTFLRWLGFRWNAKRGAWQHACGVFRRRLVDGDPRDYYGTYKVREEELSY